ERIAAIAPLIRRPLKYGIEHPPILGEFVLQPRQGLRLHRSDHLDVSCHQEIDLMTQQVEAGPMLFGISGGWIKHIVAHVRAGQIDIAAKLIQDTVARQKILADLVVAALNLGEIPYRVDTGQRHQQQQSAESGEQNQPGVEGEPLGTALHLRSQFNGNGLNSPSAADAKSLKLRNKAAGRAVSFGCRVVYML